LGDPHELEMDVVDNYRKIHKIILSGKRILPPILEFGQIKLPDNLVSKLNELGYLTPTPIQAQSMPLILRGLDLIGIAETGSGKTLAYLIPAILHCISNNNLNMTKKQFPCFNQQRPRVLILAPTRELAGQIFSYADILSDCLGLKSFLLIGGVSKSEQLENIKNLSSIPTI
jgi:superfamily II DNA/RNA helicase